MTTPPPPDNGERTTHDDIEPLGGADAVEKTTYGTGRGTTPENSINTSTPSVGQTRNPFLWIVIGIAVIIGAIYLMGIFVH
jgi:hypothetical protein